MSLVFRLAPTVLPLDRSAPAVTPLGCSAPAVTPPGCSAPAVTPPGCSAPGEVPETGCSARAVSARGTTTSSDSGFSFFMYRSVTGTYVHYSFLLISNKFCYCLLHCEGGVRAVRKFYCTVLPHSLQAMGPGSSCT
jgi:hypothetical protein